MKRWRWHIVLFVMVYAGALLATLPAAQAMRWVEPALSRLPQRPQLQGVDGSLWAGRAAQLSYRGVALGELQWRVSPWNLLLGRLNVELKLNHAEGYLDGELTTGLTGKSLRLSDVNGQVPAAWLKSFVPALPITPSGSFAVNVKEAQMESSHLQALDGRVVWSKGGVAAPLALELGDLLAEFSNGEGGIVGHIKDSGGPLQLAADLKLGPDGSYTLTGKSAARPGAAPALGTSLSLLGQPDGQGMIPFRFNGRL